MFSALTDELLARLVAVPCSQEARGLDAGPRLVQKLMSASDHCSAAIVQRISEEEVAHVAVGRPIAFPFLPPVLYYNSSVKNFLWALFEASCA